MKKSLLFLIVLLSFSFAFGQNELIVQHDEKGLYLSHTVSPGQNFYSIGRLYNISAKEIASTNALDMTKGLVIGQVIRIPLTRANFSQTSANGRPVYYMVEEKEGLYRVSMKNNKVLMASLRKWNRLSNDNIAAGQKLVVGFLNSREANNIVIANPSAITQAPEHKEPPMTQDPKREINEQKKELPPTDRKDAATEHKTATEHKAEDKKPEEKRPDERKTEIVRNETPVNKPAVQQAVHDANGGYFKVQFDQQVKVQPIKSEQTATAGIFKTSSGWQDAKYYALIDKVDPGTIIRIVNPTNNKSIYAKVLGTMTGIRQNQGYDVRISNAAASALDITDMDKFIVKVVY
jgi:LysM repeat protein